MLFFSRLEIYKTTAPFSSGNQPLSYSKKTIIIKGYKRNLIVQGESK